MKKGYYNENTIAKFAEALKSAKNQIDEMIGNGELVKVKFSNGNSKIGEIPSVSTLPFLTCPGRCAGTCASACYAAKLANMRENVRNAYAWNTALALYHSDIYHAQVKAFCSMQRYFRYHVSGDVINSEYFANMVDNARSNPHCEILAFTKRFEVVNAWINENGKIPANLHILFSGWSNMIPENPYKLPETTVYEKETDFNDSWLTCGGNCAECVCRGLGCWKATTGDVIAFKKH